MTCLLAVLATRVTRQQVADAVMFLGIVLFVLFVGTVWAVPA